MKLDQNEEAQVDHGGDSAESSSRRSFLRKSSATALVTSLAAQPVWGQCTVSGAMSGGSAVRMEDDSCIIPAVTGRSPGFWSNAMYGGNALASAFPTYTSANADDPEAIDNLRNHIDSIKGSQSFTLTMPDGGEHICFLSSALDKQYRIHGLLGYGDVANLAAIWLDCCFGFFGTAPPPGRTTSTEQDWVEHYFALVARGDEWKDTVFGYVFPSRDNEESGGPATTWNGTVV